jgi:hypothetical protein
MGTSPQWPDVTEHTMRAVHQAFVEAALEKL